MKLTGFTDEVSNSLDVQIQVTRELGWKYISLRTVDGGNIHEISDDEFYEVVEKLEVADIKVAEFGTLIGNWSKRIHSDWNITEAEMNRCIPRMKALNVKYARVMSYAQEEWGSDQMEEERFKRMRMIQERFSSEGLIALHENCMNWGGFSADHTLRLLDEVPGLKLVFDTGNPLFQKDRSKSEPFPWQNALEFYKKVKHAVMHLHVKDVIMNDEVPKYVFAGEGHAQIPDLLKELKKSNYTGFIAMEPHMGKVFHDNFKDENQKGQYEVYVQFCRKFEKLLLEVS